MSGKRIFFAVIFCACLFPGVFAGDSVDIADVTGDCVIVAKSGEEFVLAGVVFPEVPVRERLARKDRGIVQDASVDFVRGVLAGKRARIERVSGAEVKLYLVEDESLFNTAVIAEGMATADSNSALGKSPEFAAAQEKAMLGGLGVWAKSANGAPHMGVSSIDNQARTADFVSRYQGPAEEENGDGKE